MKKIYIEPETLVEYLHIETPLLEGSIKISEQEVSSGLTKEENQAWSDIWE